MEPTLSRDGSRHVTDEIINTISHLAAACLALLGSVLLIVQAVYAHKIWSIVAFAIYGFSLVNLFIFSTLHHGINGGQRLNTVLRTFDYTAVFGLIAGTVTPLCLILYRNPLGWSVLGVVWVIAAAGIALRSVFRDLPKHITNTLYIVLGWLPAVLVLIGQRQLPFGGLLLLMLGGLLYSFGFVIFVIERPNPRPGQFGFHEIWHILVVAAALCHYLFMYWFVLPH